MLSNIKKHIKHIGALWIIVFSCSFVFELIGVMRYYSLSHNTLDLWLWGVLTFIGFYIESIFIANSMQKQALKELEKFKQKYI